MLEQGDTAPDFTLADQNGDEVTLSELRGAPIVLYFYPRADTCGSKCSIPTPTVTAWAASLRLARAVCHP